MTGRQIFWLIGIALMLIGVVHSVEFMLDAAGGLWNRRALVWAIDFVIVGGVCAIVAEKGW